MWEAYNQILCDFPHAISFLSVSAVHTTASQSPLAKNENIGEILDSEILIRSVFTRRGQLHLQDTSLAITLTVDSVLHLVQVRGHTVADEQRS